MRKLDVPVLTSWTRYERWLYHLITCMMSHCRVFASFLVAVLVASCVALGSKVLWFGIQFCGAVLVCVPLMCWASLFVAWFPEPSGVHHVGSCDIEMQFPASAESKTTDSYPFWARIYYPCSFPGGTREQWLPSPANRYIEAMGGVYGVPATLALLLLYPMRFIRMRSTKNADIAQGEWSVVLFSHGLCGTRSMYSALCTELASQGYIVVAPEHTDGSACLAHRGGEIVSYMPRKEADQGKQLSRRVGELLACWSSLASVEGGRFAKSVDLSSCTLIGHSFGATTVLCAASAKPFCGISSLVILDPWISPMVDVFENVQVPTLTIMTGSMLWQPNASELVEVLMALDAKSKPAFLTEIVDARHQDVSDVPFFLHVPMALISACSQIRSGYSTWKTSSELMLRFLQFQNESEESKMMALTAVPGSRVHAWKEWVKE